MHTPQKSMFPPLAAFISKVRELNIPGERLTALQPLINYIQSKIDGGREIHLNFICTHNSRRSQFSQIWAQTAADYFGIPAHCYSGGVEVTAFNERAVESLKRSGFHVEAEGDTNPVYTIYYAQGGKPIKAFSKLFDHSVNHADQFAAVMTCSHAEENCPFIPGAEKRIPVRYDDPKAFDDTPLEATKYDERSMQIASEMLHVFASIKVE